MLGLAVNQTLFKYNNIFQSTTITEGKQRTLKDPFKQ